MATVNYDIWGTPEEWQNISSSTWVNQANCKIPKSGRTSFYNAFNAGALIAGEVPTDLSLAFWGIGKESILAHPMYLSSYWDSDTIKTAVNEVQTPNTVPCILNWTTDPSSTQANMSWSYRYAPTDNPGESNFNVINLAGNAAAARTLITSFNYQKVFLIPYVKVAKANSSSWATATLSLKEYIDSMLSSGTYSTYDKILSIGYQIAIGDGIDNNRTTGLKELGVVFPVSFEASQRSYQNGSITYTWFATRYGINAFMTNLSLNSYTHSLSPYYEWGAENFSSLHLVGDSDTGFRRKYCKNYYAGGNIYGQVPIYYYNPNDEIWKINDTVPWNTDYAQPFPYIECTNATADNVKDYVLKQIAFLGFPFMYDPTLAARGQIGDLGVYLPVFDDDGVTTGGYEEGRAAIRLRNSDWIDGHESGYDPNKPPTPEIEDEGDIPNVGLSTRRFGNHLKVWCLYQNQIDTITSAINNIYQSSSDPVVQWQTDFQGVNPADYIVGFYAMLLTPPRTDTPSTFTLGAVDFDGDISAYRYNFNAANAGFFSFGEVDVKGYGNFLDYAPYTQLEVYIPLCGTVEVDSAYFMGHKMCIDMYYDIYTMSCVAAISRISSKGKTLYKTVNGTIGAQIPILSKNMGDYQSAIHALESAHRQNENRLVTSMMTAGISAAIAIGSGGAAIPAIAGVGLGGMGMINTIEQQKQIEYQLDHTQPTIAQTGVAETQNSFCVGQLKAKLNIKRAYILPHDDTIYSSTVGNACCINTTVGAMSGLIICSDIICDNITNVYGDSPTLDEVNAIKQAFANGVII